MNYRAWQVKQPDERAASRLAGAIGAPLLLARILVARGLDTPDAAMQFLTQDPPISDPFLLKDMDKAVDRIMQAVDNEEKIVVFGDYDVDGVTATALLYAHLWGMGADVSHRLPSRSDDGYGLSDKVVHEIAESGCQLLITVDNGISAIEEVELANRLGMDVVVTDHHLPRQTLPPAVAVVDPSRPDDQSPFKCICGAGVAFKLCAALDGCEPEELLEQCGDLAALGTVADVMPLVGENRTIVRRGLSLLQNCDRPGLAALIEQCGLSERRICAENISFSLSPRLNAAGRMDSADMALDLLLAEDYEDGCRLAEQLAAANTARQEAEQRIMCEAEKLIAADPTIMTDRVMVVWGVDFHPGVIGIVANRLVEKYNKPAIVITIPGDQPEGGREGKGSGRSVPGFHLHRAIASCESLLLRFGGHAQAAGLSVTEENIPALRKALNDFAAREYPAPQAVALDMDVEIFLDRLTVEDVQGLDYLDPCGQGNPAPVFLLRNALVEAVYPVRDGSHCRLRLRQGNSCLYAVCFNLSPERLAYPVGTHVDAALSLSVFEGKAGPLISGRIQALRPAGLADCSPRQAAAFAAFRQGLELPAAQRARLLPDRSHIAAIYRLIRQGAVTAEDLQPLFARMGAENTGKTLAGLEALTELGLVEVKEIEGARKFVPIRVEGKRDLDSAPILRALKG